MKNSVKEWNDGGGMMGTYRKDVSLRERTAGEEVKERNKIRGRKRVMNTIRTVYTLYTLYTYS